MNPLLKDKRIILLLLMIVLSLASVAINGFNFGLEFSGGTRIPISLEKSVDASTMNTMIETIKTRLNKWGMSQINVKGIGDQELLVEVPTTDPQIITQIEALIKEQGRFEAIVDGAVALRGDDIISIGAGGGRVVKAGEEVEWSIDFAVSREAAERFSQVSMGKTDYPVHMFLDRPSDAIILLDKTLLRKTLTTTPDEMKISVLNESLKKIGDNSSLIIYDNIDWQSAISNIFISPNQTVVVSSNASSELISFLQNNGAKVELKSTEDMTPEFYQAGVGGRILVTSWKSIGLLSAPTLSAGLAQGVVTQFYMITGRPTGKTYQEKVENANIEVKKLRSILSGGRLPVSVIVGSHYQVAATLGEEFLKYSVIGALIAITAVSIFIYLKYKNIRIFLPILSTMLIQLIILVCIIGSFGTLDLAAMAGIIDSVGGSVDDQIIITNEMLSGKKKDEEVNIRKIGDAFYIIMTNAVTSIVGMFPLLFSGLVEIMGFAVATIIGTLLGVFVVRPAYGAIIEYVFKSKGGK